MNACPNDEFDGIFDDLTPEVFTMRSTVTFPAEGSDFEEFVAARLDVTRSAYRPGKSLSQAALSNGREVLQVMPTPGETMSSFLQRLTLHAKSMHAHSFFFSKIVDASVVLDGRGFGVLWIAHHRTGDEQILRSGLISIHDGTLGEQDETTFEDSELNGTPIGGAFTGVLMP